MLILVCARFKVENWILNFSIGFERSFALCVLLYDDNLNYLLVTL